MYLYKSYWHKYPVDTIRLITRALQIIQIEKKTEEDEEKEEREKEYKKRNSKE